MTQPSSQQRFSSILVELAKAETLNTDVVTQEAMVHQAKHLLDTGMDCNIPDATGRSLISQVGLLTRGSNPYMIEIGKALMEHGANPMLHDRALASTLRETSSSKLLMTVIRYMCELEKKEQGLRDDVGGNILHYLSWESPLMATQLLKKEMADTGNTLFPLHTINEKRKIDGCTPLHILWKRDIGANEEILSDIRWIMTRNLMLRGADIMVADDQGRRVADIIEHRVGNKHNLYSKDDTWARIESALTEEHLDRYTANSPRASGMAPRL